MFTIRTSLNAMMAPSMLGSPTILNAVTQHRDGLNPGSYTAKRRPVRLAYFEIFEWIQDAIQREKQLKGWSAAKKRALMQSDEEVLHALAACKNTTSHLGV